MNILDILRALVTGDAATLNSTDWQAEALAALDQAEQGGPAGETAEPGPDDESAEAAGREASS